MYRNGKLLKVKLLILWTNCLIFTFIPGSYYLYQFSSCYYYKYVCPQGYFSLYSQCQRLVSYTASGLDSYYFEIMISRTIL